MILKTVRIDKDFCNMEQLERIAEEAFPPKEYRSPSVLIEMAEQSGNIDFLALYDDETFIGYMVVVTHKEMAYLFFLAIDHRYRGMGYGSHAIQKLKERYPKFSHVVDFEMLDDSAPNKEQRIKRKQFYLRNGYRETGLFVSYFGVSYEVVCMGNDFNATLFKETLSTLKIDGFHPRYFDRREETVNA